MDITPPPEPPERVEIDFEEVGRFLDEVAPEWRCQVCQNNSISLFVTQKDGTIPAHIRLDQARGGLLAFRSFVGICDRCGFVHTFDLTPFYRWKKAKAEAAG